MARLSREQIREIERKASRPMRTTAEAERIARKTALAASRLHLAFFDEVVKLLPTDQPELFQMSVSDIETKIFKDECKAIELNGCNCGFHIETKQFSERDIEQINQDLTDEAGGALNSAIDNAALTWLAKFFGMDDKVRNDTVMKSGYWYIILDTFKWTFGNIEKNWKRNARSNVWARQNPFEYVMTTDINQNAEWVKEIYGNGFKLASDKITKQFTPQLKKFITAQKRDGKSWTEIARAINKDYKQRDLWHWQRLARTELASATHRASVNEMNDQGIEYLKWSAAAGRCPICDAIATGGAFGYYKVMDAPDVSGDTHPNCRCKVLPETRVPRSVLEYYGDL